MKWVLILFAVALCGHASAKESVSKKKTYTKEQSALDSVDNERELKAKEFFYQGALEMRAEHYDEAFALLRRSYELSPNSAEVAHTLGGIYGLRGNYAPTIELFDKAYRLAPDERTYMESLVSGYLWGNNVEAAQRTLEDWLKRFPGDEDLVQYLAKVYVRSGEYDKALKLYTQILEGETNYARYGQTMMIKLGLLEAAGRNERVQGAWQEFMKKFANEEEPKVGYIEWCLRSGKLNEGRPILDSLIKQGEVSQAVSGLRVRYAMADKDYSRAEQLLVDQLEKPDADVDNQLVLWYQLLVDQKQGDKLSQRYNSYFERIIKLHPEHTNAYLTYGQVLRLQEEYERAIEVVRPLVRLEPENSEVWNSLIGDAISLGRESLVTELCLEALKYIQTDWRYYYYASAGLYIGGKSAEAERIIEEALDKLSDEEHTGRSQLLGQLGDLASDRGDTVAAFRHYEAALEYQADNVSVLNNYAYALAERGEELDKAERMAAQGIKLEENNANLLDTYAWVFYKRGKYSLAHLYQKKAMGLEQHVGGAMYDHMGDIQLALEDITSALESWTKAKELYTEELKEEQTDKARKRTEQRLAQVIKKIKNQTKK